MTCQIHTVMIINKAGTSRWMKNYTEKMQYRKENDPLIFASSFHGFSIVASQICPTLKESEGIQKIQTNNFVLQCLHTKTGVKFIVIGSLQSAPILGDFLKELYKLYADYVLKDPFIILEMPIRSKKFEAKVKELVNTFKGKTF
ncbi:synbindin, putative [Entamoeba invadens IP1]|uniref:Trafficking protein particle complex subunit n=1 Tax=Entamoeba invadens IP1 TaxID=370355 RepID=A0A0A1U2B8_ENTIV|nr:synbindin, putative [Entamoeba invadens IP1]ELP88216.1 synbindin, putative [Entamoeba invadens IP1]|eukprot:XP_004254987.1 synbindin, putative [Entamoeba invadens IP1]